MNNMQLEKYKDIEEFRLKARKISILSKKIENLINLKYNVINNKIPKETIKEILDYEIESINNQFRTDYKYESETNYLTYINLLINRLENMRAGIVIEKGIEALLNKCYSINKFNP